MLTYSMDQRGGKSKYEYLCDCIKKDILSGALVGDERLPSKKALARHLGISALTVENAYSQLVAEGYIYSKSRSGFFVSTENMRLTRKRRAMETTPIVQSLVPSPAVQSDFSFASLSRIMRKVISDYGEKLLEKPPHNGCEELRIAIANHLSGYRGMNVSADRIVVGSGAEYLYMLLSLILKDTTIGIESPSYEKIRNVYDSLDVSYQLLPMDADGISTQALQATAVDNLHVTPYHSFPTGISTSASKRMEYINWVKNSGGFIIEDDFDSEFSQSKKPLETIYSMDKSDSVIYLNTFTKTMAPSMRMGYMVLPERLISVYNEKLGFYSCTVPAFDQYVVAEYISGGHFEKHLNRLRRGIRLL